MSGNVNIIKNIERARELSSGNKGVRAVVVICGSTKESEECIKRLDSIKQHIFSKDNETIVLSFEERIGEKSKEGNFLGTLLAYEKFREVAKNKGIPYQEFVTLVGMVFGRGERLSPITQASRCNKSSVKVTPQSIEIDGRKEALSAIEEALFYFTPVLKYFETNGFRGVLDKWGDETEISSVDLSGSPGTEGFFAEHDVIKLVSVMDVSEELANQKDWVVFDGDKNMVAQVPRGDKNNVVRGLRSYGVGAEKGERYFAGVSLGPVAVSYTVLDIALEVFSEEIKKKGVYIDFDPYFIMALVMGEGDQEVWRQKVADDERLRELIVMVPGFFEKAQKIKTIFKEKLGRALNVKIFDMGKNAYWADIGQHMAMREKYLSLLDDGINGDIARELMGITAGKDENGNILINSEISHDIAIKNSVVINSVLSGKGQVLSGVIIDSALGDVYIKEAFVMRSYRIGRTVLMKKSGLYESYGSGELILEEKMRHVSILTSGGKKDMTVSEETNLRDKERTYNIPILNNGSSFSDAYNEMIGVSCEEIEKRRVEIVKKLKGVEEKMQKFKPLKFGTSGLRDKVEAMTDMECFINTKGFISFLKERKEINPGDYIAFGGDRRSSTPRIMSAVKQAIEDSGYKPVFCGLVPSPTLAYYSIKQGMPSIMVTGSHIPDDRNGIKFTKKTGEVLKTDESDILRNVSIKREEEYVKNKSETLFDDNGNFKTKKELGNPEREKETVDMYVQRYLNAFGENSLSSKKIVLYQHSAVGRDIIKEIFEGLGAEVITIQRSESFVPVDTEKVSEETKRLLKEAALEYKPFAIISTDGDSDRPLLADENGDFLPGDKLGALVSIFLHPDFTAIPISANDAVVKALKAKNIKVKQTKIGSPYVIAAMNEALDENASMKVVSWESNGGFLLGSKWDIGGNILEALPTRDAVLPLIAALLLAVRENKKISELISEELPSRFTSANVVDNKTPGCENYTADMGKKIIKMFSPENDEIYQVDFENDKVEAVYADGKRQEAEGELCVELTGIKKSLAKYFSASRGFSEIVSVNFIDGIRIVFSDEQVAHIRPSGNAPEFRIYATSSSQEGAENIVSKRQEIVSQIVLDLTKKTSPESLGACKASSDQNAASLKYTSPLFITPYKEPKVWGRDGIGEYWYGAEDGNKSSIAKIDNVNIPMKDIIKDAPNDILGEKVIARFGSQLPLVKILTPRGRLSVQFHDAKNELWIVTGIDKDIAGEKPMIILGFSKEMVGQFGHEVAEKYAVYLKAYGENLNTLIDILEKNGHKSLLLEKKDASLAALEVQDKDGAVKKAYENFLNAEAGLKIFYNYKEVSIGDVIPVPQGTLHALGPGIEVVEPQIAGPTQSLEDGATYPVRYFFPGHEREGVKKCLDVDRSGEMIPDTVKDSLPEIIEQTGHIEVERLPGGFEDKGLEVHRITLKKGANFIAENITSFHNLVAIYGEAAIIVNNGEKFNIPPAKAGGEMLLVPASTGKYEIIAVGDAQIIDTFTPV